MLRFEVFNSSDRVVEVTAKTPLVALNGYEDIKVERLASSNSVITEELSSETLRAEMSRDFPEVGNFQSHPVVEAMWPLMIRADEVSWVQPQEVGRRTPYRTEQAACRNSVEAQLVSYVQRGYLRRVSNTERVCLSPLLPIRKKDGTYRFTNDFRWLNAHFQKSGMEQVDVWRRLWKVNPEWRYYAQLDLKDGFFAIPVDLALQRAFAFSWGESRYAWTRLPMGWTWSPILFSERIAEVIDGLGVVQFVDDLLLGGHTPTELRSQLRKVFSRLRHYGLKVNLKKTVFLTQKVKFLGVEIQHGYWSLTQYYRDKLHQIGTLSSRKDLERWIGVLSYIRRTVVGLEAQIKPLRVLLKEARKADQNYVWWQQANQVAYSVLRHILDRQVYLRLPARSAIRYIMESDWSDGHAGYLLFVEDHSGLSLCDLGSKKLTEPTSSFLGELRAVVWACKATKALRGDISLLIRTDNQALAAQLEQGDCGHNDKRVLRLFGWLISNESFTVEFVPGDINTGADLLSRPRKRMESSTAAIQVSRHDPITTAARNTAIRAAHAGHFGHVATARTLRDLGYSWKGLEGDVKRFVLNCPRCAQFGRPVKRPLWSPIEATQVNEVVCADYLGPINWPNGRVRVHVLLLVDALSRFVQLRVCRAPNASGVIGGLQRWVAEIGTPKLLFADSGTAFKSAAVIGFCHERNIEQRWAVAEAHFSNGLCERAIQTVLGRIRREGPTCAWPPLIRKVEFAYNRSWHSGIGCPPISLMKGLTVAGSQLTEAEKERLLLRAQRRRDFKIGDRVAVHNRSRKSKLEPEWIPGYVVTNKLSNQIYEVSDASGRAMSATHAHLMRLLSP